MNQRNVRNRFDAYHKWLGIPPAEQPPDHYRLLGIARFEADIDVISSAADRQMSYLRSLQGGGQTEDVTRLLNELSAARVCLLSKHRKAAYDAVLRNAAPAESGGKAATTAGPAVKRLITALGPLEILEQIAANRWGELYKARHESTGRFYTVKLLPGALQRHPQAVKRFHREGDILTQLEHPNLIIGYDMGEHDGMPYLVTEYVLGTDLATLVRTQGPLPVAQAVEYTLQAGRGLMQLHFHGVYHRNIQPSALLVDMQGRVRITNLLLAGFQEGAELAQGQENLTVMGQALGTAEYLPPEQARDASSVDQRADIYALGCTLHFLLIGKPPYGGRGMAEMLLAHSTHPIPSLTARRAEVPRAVEQVFQKMLRKEPQGRHAFMGEVVADLERTCRPVSAWMRFWQWLRSGGQRVRESL